MAMTAEEKSTRRWLRKNNLEWGGIFLPTLFQGEKAIATICPVYDVDKFGWKIWKFGIYSGECRTTEEAEQAIYDQFKLLQRGF